MPIFVLGSLGVGLWTSPLSEIPLYSLKIYTASRTAEYWALAIKPL